MSERRIEYVNIRDIVPAILNPKTHSTDAITASMDRMGYTEPMLEDSRTGRLIAGHGRLEELLRRQKFEESPPDGIRVVDGVWLAPVVRGWASEDDAQATAALLGSNQITMSAPWIKDEVAALLAALEETDPSLVLAAGFNEEAISEAIAAADDDRMLEPDGDADFVTVQFRVPQATADLWRAAVDMYEGTESEKIRKLAEAATGEPPPF